MYVLIRMNLPFFYFRALHYFRDGNEPETNRDFISILCVCCNCTIIKKMCVVSSKYQIMQNKKYTS